uniref:Uncharacterized protein n=1 Tax=Lepeophtheirus salmonis TaxID=72036 RepID=A0A0K2UDX3_LEPSM
MVTEFQKIRNPEKYFSMFERSTHFDDMGRGIMKKYHLK